MLLPRLESFKSTEKNRFSGEKEQPTKQSIPTQEEDSNQRPHQYSTTRKYGQPILQQQYASQSNLSITNAFRPKKDKMFTRKEELEHLSETWGSWSSCASLTRPQPASLDTSVPPPKFRQPCGSYLLRLVPAWSEQCWDEIACRARWQLKSLLRKPLPSYPSLWEWVSGFFPRQVWITYNS